MTNENNFNTSPETNNEEIKKNEKKLHTKKKVVKGKEEKPLKINY